MCAMRHVLLIIACGFACTSAFVIEAKLSPKASSVAEYVPKLKPSTSSDVLPSKEIPENLFENESQNDTEEAPPEMTPHFHRMFVRFEIVPLFREMFSEEEVRSDDETEETISKVINATEALDAYNKEKRKFLLGFMSRIMTYLFFGTLFFTLILATSILLKPNKRPAQAFVIPGHYSPTSQAMPTYKII